MTQPQCSGKVSCPSPAEQVGFPNMEPMSGQFTAGPGSERHILEQCMLQLRRHLPPSWTSSESSAPHASDLMDAGAIIGSPSGETTQLIIHTRRALAGRDVGLVAGQFEGLLHRWPKAVPVVATSYLSPTVRDRLRTMGLSHVDTTGNIWLVASRPGLFILTQGANSDPWRRPGRPRGTLKGVPAAKVVRALLDFSQPWAIRDLITHSGASVGATYRVIDYLEREGLIDRSGKSAITVPSWRALLEAWAHDYDFFRAGHVSTYLAPRGLPWLMHRVAESDGVRYAVTGSLAVPPDARYASPRAAMIYVESAAAAREAWDLRPAESGQNVLLCESPGSAAFHRARPTNDPYVDPAGDVVLARPAQVAVDLMAAPGRGPEEAQALLDWMERNEPAWRE